MFFSSLKSKRDSSFIVAMQLLVVGLRSVTRRFPEIIIRFTLSNLNLFCFSWHSRINTANSKLARLSIKHSGMYESALQVTTMLLPVTQHFVSGFTSATKFKLMYEPRLELALFENILTRPLRHVVLSLLLCHILICVVDSEAKSV